MQKVFVFVEGLRHSFGKINLASLQAKRHLVFFIVIVQSLASFAQAPLMGWSSWNTFGININEQLIKSQADAMVSSGLSEAGYQYINIDDGYFGGRDKSDGHLLIHPEKFPDGLQPVVDYIHSKGLKAGIYSDAGRNTCASTYGGDKWGIGVGLYEHDLQDCQMFFADLDFDFIKVDFCGGSGGYHRLRLNEQTRYTDISRAIKATGKKGVRMNVCRWAYPGTWVRDVAESWRTTGDINCSWKSVRSIIAENLYLSAYGGNGHYNDMDMLEVGRGLSETEDETHFAMWCIMNSPLLIGCDMRSISPAALRLLTNRELIALNQDPLLQQAYVAKKQNDCYILVKDIEKAYGTSRAIAIYNPTDTVQTVRLMLSDLDLAGEIRMKDLVSGEVQPLITNHLPLIVQVPAHGTKVYRLDAKERLERTLYEAETGYIATYQELRNNQQAMSGIYEYDDHCSGGMKATWLGMSNENSLQWNNIHSKKGGTYRLRVETLRQPDEIRSFSVDVNGKTIGQLSDTLKVMNINLKKGENTIRLYNAATWMPDIDYITVESLEGKTFTFDGIGVIVQDNFTADPAPMVDGGRLYIVAGHDAAYDDVRGMEGKYGFNIIGWLCYSTKDMKTWTDHGTIMTPADFTWGVGEAWASQMMEKDGKYYFYVTAQAGEPYNCKAIGVAVSDSPTGPFRDAIGRPLIEDKMTPNGPRGWWNDIDPTVFIDTDGTPYLCWGNGTCFMVRLKPNMVELDGDIQTIDVPNYVEGPWLHRHGDWYYLTYAGMNGRSEDICYAMSRSITGPWEAKGELMGNAERSFTIHPGIAEFRGKNYLFYHNSTLPLHGYTSATGRRSVAVTELEYLPNGEMKVK